MMRKLALALLLTIAAFSARANISLFVQAGDLMTHKGTGLPGGNLLLLVAAGADGTFSNSLGESQYVSGDEVLLTAFPSNYFLEGATSAFLSFELSNDVVGRPLALRWFEEISFEQFLASPDSALTLAGHHYGTFVGELLKSFSRNAEEDSMIASAEFSGPNGGDPWIVPADGTSVYALNFVTFSLDQKLESGLPDPQPDSAGLASYQIVPEPAMGLFCSLAVFLFLAGRGYRARENFLAAVS